MLAGWSGVCHILSLTFMNKDTKVTQENKAAVLQEAVSGRPAVSDSCVLCEEILARYAQQLQHCSFKCLLLACFYIFLMRDEHLIQPLPPEPRSFNRLNKTEPQVPQLREMLIAHVYCSSEQWFLWPSFVFHAWGLADWISIHGVQGDLYNASQNSHAFVQWIIIFWGTNSHSGQWPTQLTGHRLLRHIQRLFIHTTGSPQRLPAFSKLCENVCSTQAMFHRVAVRLCVHVCVCVQDCACEVCVSAQDTERWGESA